MFFIKLDPTMLMAAIHSGRRCTFYDDQCGHPYNCVRYESSYFYPNTKAQKEWYFMKKLNSGKGAVIQLDHLAKTFGKYHAVRKEVIL